MVKIKSFPARLHTPILFGYSGIPFGFSAFISVIKGHTHVYRTGAIGWDDLFVCPFLIL